MKGPQRNLNAEKRIRAIKMISHRHWGYKEAIVQWSESYHGPGVHEDEPSMNWYKARYKQHCELRVYDHNATGKHK